MSTLTDRNVRIVNDRGTGTKGAIGPVIGTFTYEGREVVVIDVMGKPIDIWADGVQVVEYDPLTSTWEDVK